MGGEKSLFMADDFGANRHILRILNVLVRHSNGVFVRNVCAKTKSMVLIFTGCSFKEKHQGLGVQQA